MIADWKNGPHLLTYRQAEYTFGLVADALAKDEPDGLPSPALQAICDDLLEASIPEEFKDASASLAVDWTDLESFSRPPPAKGGDCADPEASWGHRKNNLLRSEDELFFGYYFSAAIMMPDENGPAVPELARRATVSSCRHDPVRAFAPVLTAMPGQRHPARRRPRRLRLRAPRRRRLGDSRSAPPARSSSRTCTRTTAAPRAPTTAPSSPTATSTAPAPPARCWNSGRLPAPPPPKTPPRTTPDRRTRARLQARPHHRRRRRRLPPRPVPGRHGQDPLPAPPAIDDPGPGPARDPQPPQHPQACCAQQTITVPPEVNAKTAQKHHRKRRLSTGLIP